MFWRRKRIELVRVGDDIDDTCAVLTMIARYHGRDLEPGEVLRFLEQVAEEPELDRSAMDIINAAAELGLIARGLQLQHQAGFNELTYPCIGHLVSGDHTPAFVVIEAIRGVMLDLVDPYTTRKTESVLSFYQRSSGVVLVFERGQPLPSATLRR